MSVISELVKRKRAESGLSQSEFAELFGTTQVAVSRWESGKVKPSLASLYKMGITEESEKPNAGTVKDDVKFIPVVDRIISTSAGVGNYYGDVTWNVTGKYPVESKVLLGYSWQGAEFYVFFADGDSMEPHIHDGSRLLVAENIEINSGDVAVVSLNNALFVKGVLLNKDGSVTLVSFNKAYPDRRIDPQEEEFKIVGKVLNCLSITKVPSVV